MRSAGVLMPITSLPSPWGIGTLGRSAREFLGFLAESGQTYWQLLPIGPTGYGDSPYQPFSSYAGNPYLIDLDDLAKAGLLLPEEYQGIQWGTNPARVDYGLLYQKRFQVLKKAVDRLWANNKQAVLLAGRLLPFHVFEKLFWRKTLERVAGRTSSQGKRINVTGQGRDGI